MTTEQFAQTLARWQRKLPTAIPRIAHECGVRAVELFRENFDKESFFGEKWEKRKVAKNGALNTKILQKSGDLSRSMEVTQSGGTVTITSDLPYSKIHNEGGTIKQTATAKQAGWMRANLKTADGKKYKVKEGSKITIPIPQRQFMGDHPKLRAELKKTIEEQIIQIFK
jgi:phage gpG-like protein